MTSLKEQPHSAAFILSEAPGHLSRDNIKIAAGQDFPPGTVLANGGGGYAPGLAGSLAIAIYGAKTGADPVEISAITRSAEVNRHVIAWPEGTSDAAIDAAATELAKQMIIVRGAALPSPVIGVGTQSLPSPPPSP